MRKLSRLIPVLMLALVVSGCATIRMTFSEKPKPAGERLIWFSTYANLSRLKDSESVDGTFKKCADAGLTGVVIDIETKGYLTFPSILGPHFSEKEGWPFANNYDLLATCVARAHKYGLSCYVTYFGTHLYPLDESWRFVNFEEAPQAPQGVNPFLPDVRARYFNLIREVVSRYDIDGLMLDGIRFRGHDTDFSQWMRDGFERYLGEPVEHWPQSVLTFRPIDEQVSKIVPGPLYKQWAYYRASLVKEYIHDLRKVVKRIRPDVVYADYVGSWYPDYSPLGANWASKKFHAGYDWMNKGYRKTGYAEELDALAVGLYFDRVTVDEARLAPTKDYYSVEGAAEMAEEVVAGRIPLLGTLYVIQYQDNPDQFKKAVKMALEKTEGLGIFDAVYIEQYGWWEELKQAIQESCPPEMP